MSLRISYNSPVVLTTAIICSVLWALNEIMGGGVNQLLLLDPHFSFLNPVDYLNLFSYTLVHASASHLMGNMTFFLLLGPILEEKYGSRLLLIMLVTTALATAILHLIFFQNGLLGASGIVFMFIMLASLTNVSGGKIPLTFILILILYLGKEVYASFQTDQISQFAHILGGICGSIFGFVNGKKGPRASTDSSPDLLS